VILVARVTFLNSADLIGAAGAAGNAGLIQAVRRFDQPGSKTTQVSGLAGDRNSFASCANRTLSHLLKPCGRATTEWNSADDIQKSCFHSLDSTYSS